MNTEIVRMNLAGMSADKRSRIAAICNNVLLRSLLPPRPPETEVEDAKAILSMIGEIDGD